MNESNFNQPDIMRIDYHSEEWKNAFKSRLQVECSGLVCHISDKKFIQFPTAYNTETFDTENGNGGLHYEYINRQLYLHVEDGLHHMVVKDIVDFLCKEIRNSEYEWEPEGRSLGAFRKKNPVEIVDDEEQLFSELKKMMDFFNPLLELAKAAYPIVDSNAPHTQDAQKCSFKAWDTDCKEDVCCCSMNLENLMSYNLTIPDYQRDYCWEDDQIKSLFESVKEFAHIEYHLGTLILHKNGGCLNIVDGQQRLVTLTLLLKKLGYDGKLPLLFQKFQSQDAINHVANTKYVLNDLLNSLHANKREWASSLAKNIIFSVLVLQNNNLDLAYTFFSNQNSRGVPLTDYDILKAHHLRYITNSDEAAHWAKRWDELTSEGEGCVKGNNLSVTLGTHLCRLRQWMRSHNFDENAPWKVKHEFSAAPVMLDVSPLGGNLSFNAKIMGGVHFFAYADKFVGEYVRFKQTPQYQALNTLPDPHFYCNSYPEVMETLLFAYYLKFGTQYLSEALYVISAVMADYRYTSARTIKIQEWGNESQMVLMIDQASSPTFFLAEALSRIRESGRDLSEDDVRVRFWLWLRKIFSSLVDSVEEKEIRRKILEEYEL